METNNERCLGCGIKIGPMPEDAEYEEMLCNRCYEREIEKEKGQGIISLDIG